MVTKAVVIRDRRPFLSARAESNASSGGRRNTRQTTILFLATVATSVDSRTYHQVTYKIPHAPHVRKRNGKRNERERIERHRVSSHVSPLAIARQSKRHDVPRILPPNDTSSKEARTFLFSSLSLHTVYLSLFF